MYCLTVSWRFALNVSRARDYDPWNRGLEDIHPEAERTPALQIGGSYTQRAVTLPRLSGGSARWCTQTVLACDHALYI